MLKNKKGLMAKKKVQSAFFCQNCGTQSPKWMGKCSQCNEWNTFVEEVISKEEKTTLWNGKSQVNTPILINSEVSLCVSTLASSFEIPIPSKSITAIYSLANRDVINNIGSRIFRMMNSEI